jgi:hypothetical protein
MTECKIQGCVRPSIAELGLYARLCETHKVERAAMGRTGPRRKVERHSVVPRIQELAEIARRIEQHAAHAHEVRNLLIQDVTHFNQTLDDIKSGMQAIIKPA